VGETYRGLRNTLRFQLSNLYDFDPRTNRVAAGERTGLDRWFLHQFLKLEGEVAAAYRNYEFHVVYQRLSQFATVELSSAYHDLTKDRLYTDPANSRRRRSTQSTFHYMASRLCEMLSPILAFTADEAWEFLPGREAESVHLAEWRPEKAAALMAEVFPGGEPPESWKRMFDWRERLVLPELEKARQAKLIGKSLEAKVILEIAQVLLDGQESSLADFAEILNVSQLVLKPYEPAIGDLSTMVKVAVEKADGTKCERCWHFETDVGTDPGHQGLCGRCLEAVGARAPRA
jgi:isoleucyl-tRNA synthetase